MATSDQKDAKDQKADSSQERVIYVERATDPAAIGAQARLEGQALKLDEVQEGGRYIVNDQTVDANGRPVKDKS